jgi:hypothetical protein
MLAVLAGCSRDRAVAVRVQVCGFLCGDHSDGNRLSNDYTGIGCAESVRIRAIAADDPSTVVAETCIDLRDAKTQFQDLFDDVLRPTPGRPAPLPGLPASGRVAFEVALYPPSAVSPCQPGAPFVGFGRSANVDLARPPDTLIVPLGCHEICDIQSSVSVAVWTLEDPSVHGPDLPDGTGLVDIFPYEALTSTAGACTTAHVTMPRSETRLLPATYVAPNRFQGAFAVDQSLFAGCVAVALPNALFGCVEADSRSTFNVWLPSDAHLDQLRQLASANVSGTNGVLVVRVHDVTTGAPVPDARVYFVSPSGRAEADYVAGPDWSMTVAGTGVGTEGVGIFTDAPGGPYVVVQSTGEMVYFHAAGADEPTSITTYTVFLQ